MHVRCLLYMLNKCYLYTVNILYLYVLHMQLDWTSKAVQITREAPKARCHFCPFPSHSRSPHHRFESESSGPSGLVPTSNNGRISTASGLAISCSLTGCERLREEGASTSRGTKRCLEIFGVWDL